MQKIQKSLLLSLVLMHATTALIFPLDKPESVSHIKFVYAEYMPANYPDKNGKHSGFFIDIFRELFENRLNIPLTIETYPWVRCQAMLEQGNADFIATIPTPERLLYSEPVDTPFWIKKYRLYTYSGNSSLRKISAVRSIRDFKESGLSFVSYIGNNWSKTMLEDEGIAVINAKNTEGMYLMLSAGRGDVIAEDPILAAFSIKEYSQERKIILTEGIMDQSFFHILLGRKSPYLKIRNDIKAALDRMWEDGTINKIISGYSR